MNEEEIKKMQAENTKLKADLETATAEVTTLKADNTKLGADITERDTKITKLTGDATERAHQFKKLKDMTEAEKELLSEKEKELLIRQEKLEDDQAKFSKDQGERTAKEKTERIEQLATKIAKGNKDLVAQIKINLTKLDPALLEKATTEAELMPHIDSAFKMTGVTAPTGDVREAHNQGGFGAGAESKDDFSGTKEGKDMAGAMGLKQATPEGVKAVEAGGEAGAQ